MIVPVKVSNDNPAGRLGEISHVISPTSISVAKFDAERVQLYGYTSSKTPSNPKMFQGLLSSRNVKSAPVVDVIGVPEDVLVTSDDPFT